MSSSRRVFLKATGSLVATRCLSSVTIAADKPKVDQNDGLAGKIGITTSSVGGQLSGKATNGKFTLLELPRIMREELDMTVIDLNTSSLASTEPAYLDRLRKAADDAGCVLTNLKMNQRNLDMNHPNQLLRGKAIAEYERSIDAASYLGLKWARPLPLKERPNMAIHVESYQRLCEYAADKNVEMLVENFGWMQSDPDSVVKLVESIGNNVAACPDTGNWDSNELRYAGLAKTFPIAVTCDFKARTLGPNGEHKLYDLKKCFDVGWKAGFRGPWCLEHANSDTKVLLRELSLLRDMLRTWMASNQDVKRSKPSSAT